MSVGIVSNTYANLTALIDRQLEAFPEHAEYLRKRFQAQTQSELAADDGLAAEIMLVAGTALDQVCQDYRWLAGIILDEELVFRRIGQYRLSRFADAVAQVYANAPFMARYVNGILASQLWWSNHAAVSRFFRGVFLPGNAKNFSHLEIGPGHGLFLHAAASAPHCASIEGWDISPTSLAETRKALNKLAIARPIQLREVDLQKGASGQFDSITFSEVIEHLEDPRAALRSIHGLLAPEGRLFLNAPVNSPAPDHIYLFHTPEEILILLEDTGFAVKEHLFAPCTGASLERARRLKLSISTAVIATRA